MAGRKKQPQDFFKVQSDIRRNASRLQDSLRDLADWETSVKKKDLAIRKKVRAKKSIPAVRGSGRKVYAGTTGSGGAVKPHPWLKNNNSDSTTNIKEKKKKVPSAHVYDKGYSKWEKFDVDSALKEVDTNDNNRNDATHSSKNTSIFEENDAAEEKNAEATKTTPKYASPAAAHRARKAKEAADKAAAEKKKKTKNVTRRPPQQPQISREEIERLDGNKLYKKGDFNGAIKCYTRCIGLNPENHVAYSNRAMAYLKGKNFASAEEDCSSALRLNPKHVKSWNRRGTARNKLGRHRAALRDFEAVLVYEPRNKQAINEIRKTREAIKISVKKAPKKIATITESGGKSIPWVTSGPSAERNNNSAKNSNRAEPAVEEIVKTTNVTSNNTNSGAKANISTENSQVVDKAQAVVRQRAREIALSQTGISPNTMFDFMNIWNSLKGDNDGKILYLKSIEKSAIKRVFKGEIEADVFIEILKLCKKYLDSSEKRVIELVSGLSNCSNFDMNIMFCNDQDKDFIKDYVNEIIAHKNDDKIKSKTVKLIDKIGKSKFGKIL
jgi:RNA polymerase II-associated protein 3